MISPKSAYIHVPFCSHRCGYCNFTLIAGRDDLMEAYLSALELELSKTLGTPREVETVFLGGGTPTHLPPRHLEELLQMVGKWLPCKSSGEYSCEANPLDCTHQRLDILVSAGVNRLSVGGQSFSDRKLKALERDHGGKQLREALERCSQKVANLSLDLIFAAPEESLREWQLDLQIARQSPIQHLSTYGLTIERGSAFYGRTLRKDLSELDSELQLAMYEYAIDSLTADGWEHYEVSNFGRPGMHCRHNLSYWLGEAWWGFGPGAASFLPDSPTTMVRAVNHQSTTHYIRRTLAGESPTAERVSLSVEQRVRERLVFGLRRMEGVLMSDLDDLFGHSARLLFEPWLTDFLAEGLLEEEQGRLRLTPKGLMVSDCLWPSLLG